MLQILAARRRHLLQLIAPNLVRTIPYIAAVIGVMTQPCIIW